MDLATILSERLRRQRLVNPLKDPERYIELFRQLQPVSPQASSMPGSPPRLVHRTTFDDGAVADEMRERRSIVKGRFLGGTIGYVLAQDLELYAIAFRRPLSEFNETQEIVLDAIRSAETLTPRQLKEETGLLNKKIMPALHRLQEAFIVYEDQIDTDWERNWYDFAVEWPDVDLERGKREVSAAQVLLRFLRSHVFATLEQLKDWSRWPARFLAKLISEMEKKRAIILRSVNGPGEGWMSAHDVSLGLSEPSPSVFMLHKADFLVKSHVSELKRRFSGQEVLQYLLIDGAFKGAVLGHWRIGPHDVDDIIMELPAIQRTNRRDEILNAVSWGYRPPHSHILKYDGKKI